MRAASMSRPSSSPRSGPQRCAAQPTPTRPAPAPWQQSLDALLPPASTNDRIGTPLAIELSLSASGPSPTLDARLMRPGKRGGWVAGDLSWSNVHMLGHRGHPDAQVKLLQKLYATFQASSSNSTGYQRYSYGSYTYGNVKTISLLRFESPQLWPLLDEARRVGVRWSGTATAGYSDVCHGGVVPGCHGQRAGRSDCRARASGRRHRRAARGVRWVGRSRRSICRRRIAARPTRQVSP